MGTRGGSSGREKSSIQLDPALSEFSERARENIRSRYSTRLIWEKD
jgi:hypothetical protein